MADVKMLCCKAKKASKYKVIINVVLGYCFIWGQFPLFLEDFEERKGFSIVQPLDEAAN